MSYINENCIYKILPKVNPEKAIQVDKSKMIPVLFNKSNTDRSSTDDDYQNWYFEHDEKHQSYKIVNLATKKMLRYDEDDSQDVLMDDLSVDSLYCHWLIQVTNDGYVIIRNAGDPKRVLDIEGSNGRNGAKVILFRETTKKNQRFKLVRYKFKKDFKYDEAKKLETPHIQLENTYRNLDDLKYKVFSSEQFIKKWAYIADMLGLKWCSGTRGVDIGEDFTVTKLHNGNYTITANYRKGDPFAYGVGPSHRLVMEVSNVKLTFDPHSIKVGKPTITKLTPTVLSTTNAVNHTSSEGTVTTEVEYTVGHTVSNSTSNSISNSIGVENSFKVKVHGAKFEQTFSYNITHDKTWGEQVDKSKETKLKSIYSTPVPSESNVPIYALLYQSKANVPYKAVANIEYAIRISGFLKADNALKDKNKQNQKVYYSFGDGKIPATKFLQEEYLNRNVHGDKSGWDYEWCILNYEPEYFNKYMSEAITPDGVQISGIFTNISSTNVSIVAGRKSDEDNYKILSENNINGTDIKDEGDSTIKEEIDINIEVEKA